MIRNRTWSTLSRQVSVRGWWATFACIAMYICSSLAVADALEDGTYAYEEGNFATALEILLPIANVDDRANGDPEAQVLIGEMYYLGEGVEQNFEEAATWYLAAAKLGNAYAQYSAGYVYQNGEGVDADVETAIKWYTLAAEQSQSDAHYQLGWLYLEGGAVSADIASGLNHLVAAAGTGLPDANYDLGSIYQTGVVVKKDLVMALQYYREADNLGHGLALQAIVPILIESVQSVPYPDNIANLGLSNADYDSLYCENMAWATAEYLKQASSNGTDIDFDAAVTEFTDDALSMIDRFRKGLLEKFETERYREGRNYREFDALLRHYFDSFNGVLLLKQFRGEMLTNEDTLALRRLEGGIVDVVYDDSFRTYFDSLDVEEVFSTWDNCVSKYMPDGIFADDISSERLSLIFDASDTQPSMFAKATSWSKRRIAEIDVCEGDADFVGGASVGILATSYAAGDSALVILGSSGALMAIIPAIAPAVTIAAAVGSTVYLGAQGYCYLSGRSKHASDS